MSGATFPRTEARCDPEAASSAIGTTIADDEVSQQVEPLIADWCARHLGSPAVRQFFGLQRLSSVHGVALADGREIVLKVRADSPRWAGCARVHQVMWEAGIPCPRLLAGPLPLVDSVAAGGASFPGEGMESIADLVVNAETWEGAGVQSVLPPGDGSVPAGGEPGSVIYARLLAQMAAAAPALADVGTLAPVVPWLWWDHGIPGRIWCAPFSDRWDPHRVIDVIPDYVIDAAIRARERLLRSDFAALPRIAGHGDFEAQNCRWVADGVGGQRIVVHDWDSVVALPEAALAGNSALNFVSVDECDIASIDQTDEFLAAYADTRGRPWTSSEIQIAYAVGVWVAAYNAAFEHLKTGPGPVTAGLREQAAPRLARANA